MTRKHAAGFRPITDREKHLLEKLLGVDFIGHKKLLQQLPGLLARPTDDTGTVELKANAGPASPRDGCVVEARFRDGMPGNAAVAILLHVKEGRLWLLEVYKEDGSPILKEPTADQLRDFFTQFPER